MKTDFKIIGFDADDTLWVNEPYYQETEKIFCELLSDIQTEEIISKELFKTEMQNLDLYGYGVKGFVLSMIETALQISNNKIEKPVIDKIISLGKDLINKPVVLLEGIQEIVEKLTKSGYKLIIATKGDLLDQERKLKKSNIEKYFHHVEIMSDKKELNYQKLLSHLDIASKDFLMIGNSLKSDIIPVLNLGGYGVHIPYHTIWTHEAIKKTDNLNNFWEIELISEIQRILDL
ncbi:MAG: HAD family hydrolase [Bacteroidales bacterium]|nr:HAD family hydrolase [Bacteroidales bacterium]